MTETKPSLLKDFYEVKNLTVLEDNKIKAEIHLNKGHDIFKGHFPGHPVTPGVCMMQMIKEIVENYLQTDIQLRTAENVKFMAIVNPEENAEIGIDFDISFKDDTVIIKSIISFEDTVALKFSGIYNKI